MGHGGGVGGFGGARGARRLRMADARDNLLVYQGFLQFVWLLIGLLYGKLFDLSQLSGETFI